MLYAIENQLAQCYESMYVRQFADIASDILDLIESEGMLPPIADIERFGEIRELNEWEEEDE